MPIVWRSGSKIDYAISTSLKVQLRAEAFNILNHTNFLTPNTTLTVTADPKTGKGVFNSPDFGLITAARSARFLQLVARFEF